MSQTAAAPTANAAGQPGPGPVPSGAGRVRSLPYLLATVCFGLYASLSVTKHLRGDTTGFDLGIFETLVRAYAEGRAPVVELKGIGFNLLGDHFHPILVTLAPFYRLFPTPITLLVAQALLLALSVIPVTRAASRLLGAWPGLGIGIGYGLSWGIQKTVVFDFHEVAFAVPLLAFALEALLRRRWWAAVLWVAPLVLVKEDLPLTVAALGGYLLLQRQWRLGLGTGMFAGVAMAVAVFVVLPAFNPTHSYPYWSALSSATPPPGDEGGLVWIPPIETAPPLQVKAETVFALLAPTAFVALRSPLLLIALPTVAWRFLSSKPEHWTAGFHYSAILMPITFLAAAHGLTLLRAHGPRQWSVRTRRRMVVGVSTLAALASALVPPNPSHALLRPSSWQVPAEAQARVRLLATIPDGATVAAANSLAARLTGRCTVYLFPLFPNRKLAPEWIAVALPADSSSNEIGMPEPEQLRKLAQLRQAGGYRTVGEIPGLLLLRKAPSR